MQRCFLYTGNTNWGVQNLEYDAHGGQWLAAVYPGKKDRFANYSMFVIDGAVAPVAGVHDAYGKEILLLTLAGQSDFPHGSTGMISLGDSYFYFSEHFTAADRESWGTNVVLYRFDNDNGFLKA